MKKSMVVYWSQTGNTEAMAKAIGEGLKSTCEDSCVKTVSEVSASDLKDLEGFALGCPAMGDEVLEETEFEPFIEEVEQFVGGKKIVIFGSYSWGDGQWMRDWKDRMEAAGAQIIGGEGLMINDAPDDAGLETCKELGANLGLA